MSEQTSVLDEVNNREREQRPTGQTAFNGILLLLSLVVLGLAWQISGFAICAPGTVPMGAAAVMVAAMVTVLVKERRSGGTGAEEAGEQPAEQAAVLPATPVKRIFTREFVSYSLLIVLYVSAIPFIHFLPASFLFLLGSILVLRGARPLPALLISAGILGFVAVVFVYLFNIILP